jgi:hypothetical protein
VNAAGLVFLHPERGEPDEAEAQRLFIRLDDGSPLGCATKPLDDDVLNPRELCRSSKPLATAHSALRMRGRLGRVGHRRRRKLTKRRSRHLRVGAARRTINRRVRSYPCSSSVRATMNGSRSRKQ